MTTSPAVDFDGLVAERATLKADIDTANQRVKDIDHQLRESHDYGAYEYAGLKVSVEHNRRFNPARFRDAYPVDQHPDLWKITVEPDTAAIKAALAPNELDGFYDEGTPKVVVR